MGNNSRQLSKDRSEAEKSKSVKTKPDRVVNPQVESFTDIFANAVGQDAGLWYGLKMAELSKHAPRQVFYNTVKPFIPVAKFLTGPGGAFLQTMDMMGTFDKPYIEPLPQNPLVTPRDATNVNIPQKRDGGWLNKYN